MKEKKINDISQFFKKINQIDRYLARPTKKKYLNIK